jgi:hypothetical protein
MSQQDPSGKEWVTSTTSAETPPPEPATAQPCLLFLSASSNKLYPPAFGRKHRARQFLVPLTIVSNTPEDTTLARYVTHPISSNRPGPTSATIAKAITANPP